jgi:hypothetical protein
MPRRGRSAKEPLSSSSSSSVVVVVVLVVIAVVNVSGVSLLL